MPTKSVPVEEPEIAPEQLAFEGLDPLEAASRVPANPTQMTYAADTESVTSVLD